VAVRQAELLVALSGATDLGYGQPLQDGLRVCLLALRVADELGAPDADRRRVFDLALIRHIGCVADADEVAAVAGDEIALREPTARMDLARPAAMLPHMLRHVGRTQPPAARPAAFVRLARGVPAILGTLPAVCEVAELLAERLAVPAEVRADIVAYEERWDGKGLPGRVAGDELPGAVQIVQAAEAAESFRRVGGAEAARDALRRRAGSVLSPTPARLLAERGAELLADVDAAASREELLSREPPPWPRLDGAELERALEAFADFADLRSLWLSGHSRGVAALAAAAGERAGLAEPDVRLLRHAGLVHDLGRAGVSASVWGSPRPLSSAQWEQVRLHAYHGERLLAGSHYLEALGAVASRHHERLDGSGYFRGARASDLPAPARILAAADVHHALGERRPHRPALDSRERAAELAREVRAGRLDGDAVAAVLEAGDGRARRRVEGPAGLTPRELEVLRLLARGATKAAVARELVVAPKTIDAHAQSIYAKLGVSSRAAMTLTAIRLGLL
jgi:HD-GYP domain-containing protein (c-di-GMP phosphodiesterase class II)